MYRKSCFIILISLMLSCTNDREKHVYLLVGQSNMAGRGQIELIDTTVHKQVFMYTKDRQWVPAKEPMHFDRPERIGVGPGFAFGRKMVAYNPKADIYLVPSAVGASRIEKWQTGAYFKTTDSYPYDDAIARTKEALKNGGLLKGILWHQGEADSRSDRHELYLERLMELMQRFRKDLDAENVPIVLGEIGRFHAKRRPQADIINKIINEAAGFIPNAVTVSSLGLKDNGDSTHFDSSAYRELGDRYADSMIALQNKDPNE